MKNKFKLSSVFFIAAVILVISSSSYAADDFQLWFEVGAKYNLNKKFRLDFDQHIRLDDNASGIESISPELAVKYDFLKFLSFKGGYRFTVEPVSKNGGTVNDYWHRIFADARFRQRFKPISLIYRFRFQEVFGWPKFEFGGAKFKHTIRNKIELQWDATKDLEPFFSAEVYARINDNDGILHKYRITLGAQYDIGKHTPELFYRYEELLNGSDQVAHIIGLGYHYEF